MMKIVKKMGPLEMLEKMIEANRLGGSNPKYVEFLTSVYNQAYRDCNFAAALEACLSLSAGDYPTLAKVEICLAKMEGGIRPLLESRGIVEPRPMPKMEV